MAVKYSLQSLGHILNKGCNAEEQETTDPPTETVSVGVHKEMLSS